MVEHVMDAEFGPSALDRGVQGLLGKGVDRVDGPLKVTGTARYGYEHRLADVLYGFAITSTVAKGRVLGFDVERARAMPGVVDIIVDDPRIARQTAGFLPSLQGNEEIDHWGQVLGVAIAETIEQARAAALAVGVRVDAEPGRFVAMENLDRAENPPPPRGLPDTLIGDLDAAMTQAAVTIDQHYHTPHQVHAAIEPHASIAHWQDGKLTLYASVQVMWLTRPALAKALGVEPERVRVVSPYIGGGFGGKAGLGADAVLAAIAAERLGRPVKVAFSRQQLFHAVYRRSETYQHLRLAADTDGRLLAIGHESIVTRGSDGAFMEAVAIGTGPLYAAPVRRFTHRMVPLDLVMSGAIRAPGEAVGMLGLETAMDELAEKLGLDPVEFRRRNEPPADPTTGQPFSTRRMIDCLDQGAERFGWARRSSTPGAVRDGDWLVGMGMASAVRNNPLLVSSARVRLSPDGRVAIETDMTDIGTGMFTVLAQIAGEALGVPIDCIDLRVGDTDYPQASGSGGSFGAASAGSSVALACEDIANELARRMGTDPADMTLKDGHAIAGNRRVPLATLAGNAPIEALGTIKPGANNTKFRQTSFGAVFAEVGVHAVTGEARVRRMLGMFDAGRILNAKTARSQALGGMIWGIGYALMEDAVVDTRRGHFVNHDLAEYHVPSHADVPPIEVAFIEEQDRKANPLGSKGLGELSIAGAGAAVTNAIYNACGVRARDFPLTLDKILAELPPA